MHLLAASVQPDAGGKNFIEGLNPNCLMVITAIVEPSLANALPSQNFQFERHGYFVADRVDHVQVTKPVFNLAVGKIVGESSHFRFSNGATPIANQIAH